MSAAPQRTCVPFSRPCALCSKGIPRVNSAGGGRGDFFVIFKVVVPSPNDLSANAKHLLEEYSKEESTAVDSKSFFKRFRDFLKQHAG